MGVQGFQEYIEKHCPSAVVPVELQKLARGSLVGGGRQRPPQSPLRLLVDAENCLHRLYGGFYTDWVSGGQWNHMLGYLAALAKACFTGNIELLVCFNGALEKGRLHEWVKRQVNERQTAQQIISHVQNRGTPPPKVWFLPPVCMAHCIRLALLRFRIGVVQSIEDHHQEVIALCRENGFHGLVAYDSDYALCNIPYYFSAHALKLSRNGKSLTTSQYLMHEVAKQLDLHPNRFVIFASLLGNHILPDEDLAAFHWSSLGPEHPLASLKVRAHQLVLPPCDVVIRAVADYVRNLPDINDLEAIAKDIFKHSQSRTDEKLGRFKKAVEYYSAASRPLQPSPYSVRPKRLGVPGAAPHYIHTPPQILNIPQPAIQLQSGVQQQNSSGADPATKGLSDQNSFSNIPHEGKPHTPLYERASPINPANPGSPNHTDPAFFNTSSSSSSSSENEENTGPTANHICDHKGWDKQRNQMDSIAEGDAGDQNKVSDSAVASVGPGLHGLNAQIPSLLSMPTRNHMDITTPALPPVAPEVLRVAEHRHKKGLMYPYIYHVLTKVFLIFFLVPLITGVLFTALCASGKALTFPINQHIPEFEFMLQWPGVRILRRNELDAFLAQALSPKLYEPDQLQELKIDNLDPRGVQLAALFMSGVDMALFANDVCGQPIPWEHCCPWMYFDGKLLQSKLIRATRDKAPLIDLCDGQSEQVAKVEKMRQSILEAGLQHIPSHGGKLEIAGTVVGQWAGARRGRGRGSFPIQVVSTRGRNCVISTPVIRTFGRGAKFYGRGFKSQVSYQSKPAYTASAGEAAKDRKKPKVESKASPEAPAAAENGLEVGEAEQVNGNKVDVRGSHQPESAFSNDSKMCNINPHLNALNSAGERRRDDAVSANANAAAAVLQTEE
uniref:Family with sequence similarity 120A n=1 Tax=Astyanax mexicanus TaxID=7994 RepID=A0A8B9GN38_ASTMX